MQILQRVNEAFTAITPQEYEASEQVWDNLYRERVRLREELQKVDLQIQAVEKIIGQPIKEDWQNREMGLIPIFLSRLL